MEEKMRTIRWLLILACSLCLVAGCATWKKKQASVVDDKAICTEIEQRLLAETGPAGPFSLDVDSYRGTVTLDGVAGSEDQKAAILNVVKGVEGVVEVHDYIEMSTTP